MRTRREFLVGCSVTLSGLALASSGALAVPGASANRRALAEISSAAFASQVNTRFRVRLAAGQVVDLKLREARLARRRPAGSGRGFPGDAGNEKFSLFFNGPADDWLESGIYQFEHPQLGRFSMHLGRVGPNDPARRLYEAVFNRPAPAASLSSRTI